MYKKLFLFVFLTLPILTLGQVRLISGTVIDEDGYPLLRANVQARSLSEDKKVAFAMVNDEGNYQLKLEFNKAYRLSVSYIGYLPDSAHLAEGEAPHTIHFKLKSNSEQMDEVVINYQYKPIDFKKDTTIYNVSAFMSGNERKLKDVLQKLPGVEVNDGQVTVNGKPISNMLVEGKKFFGGGSKLAIENIPADALKQVEVIDHYNEVGLLKNVSGSDELAMNIKLKDSRKRLFFGDIEAGAGNEEHHLAHAALFRYTPKKDISLIADINDIGKPVFTFADMLRFQGGASSFIRPMGRPSFTNMNSFTTNGSDFVKNKSAFGALSFNNDITDKLNVSGFAIFTKDLTTQRKETSIDYLINQGLSREERIGKQQSDDWSALANVKIDFKPNATEQWYYNGQWQGQSMDFSSVLNSYTNIRDNQFETSNRLENQTIKQYIEWHKLHNLHHISTVVINHGYDQNTPHRIWLNDQPFLLALLPMQPDQQYRIEQVNKQKNQNVDVLWKHYWTLSGRSQLHFNIGNYWMETDLTTSEYQL